MQYQVLSILKHQFWEENHDEFEWINRILSRYSMKTEKIKFSSKQI